MQNDSRHDVETLFHAATSRPSGAERDAYLDGACGDDAELRSRVEALLDAHDAAGTFLNEPVLDSAREGPGRSIGAYRLLQEIGEGGMGVVYMAEQERPVRRKVAVKVIKLGMDTKQVIARFEAERQALALMDHANIARVLDAGSTESGRPYFVMELVRGIAISEYCDKHKLDTNERLGLFVDVCRAVQHAHQKGIIHRDIKPSNVLVTSHDRKPVPKIIDFGVAKATNQRLTERTLFTEYHQIIGTPEYMSPEQAEMNGLDVDTRSDIYSLGVLLYQLLTGTTPVDPTELRTVAYSEMTRMIREDEAPAPSTRITKLGEEADVIAKSQGSDVRTLARHFRGDLDWIVLKALDKDRTRRYANASDFAEDVERHLDSRPVEASPPGAWYRARKFAHRNQRAVIAVLALVAVVGLGLAGTTAGFVRARAEANRSRSMSDSLQDVLAMTDPSRSGEAGDVEEVLTTVRETFGEDHATYAAVLDTLAQRLHDAGDFEASAALCRESLVVWRRVYGDAHPNVALALARLGTVLRAQGKNEAAEPVLRDALAIFDGAAEAPQIAGNEARLALADLLGTRGEYDEADALIGQSLALLRSLPAPPRFEILCSLEKRHLLRMNQPGSNTRETAKEIYEEASAFYPEDSPVRAIWALSYGRQLFQHGDVREAEPLIREAFQHFRSMPEPPLVFVVSACDAMFQLLRSRNDPASVIEADEMLAFFIEYGQTFISAQDLAENRMYYARRMLDRGLYAEGIQAVIDTHVSLVDDGRTSRELESVRDRMTGIAWDIARQPELEHGVYARAQEAVERALNEEPDKPAMLAVLGALLYRQGEYAIAAETLSLAGPLSRASGGLAHDFAPADHAFRAMAYARLGEAVEAQGELRTLHAALETNAFGTSLRTLAREADAVVTAALSSRAGD